MAYRPPTPIGPTRRLPWIVLGVGTVLILTLAVIFLLNRRGDINLTLSGERTPTPTAGIGVVTAVVVAPTETATPTPIPPSPTAPPATDVVVIVVTATPIPTPAAPPPTAPATKPAQPAGPTAAPPPPPAPPPTATPEPFTGQVSGAGGLGNTAADIGSAYGAPAGETPGRLVAYRRDGTEFRVGYTPEPPRAAIVVLVPPASAPLTLEAAMGQARTLFPRDAQPRSAQPEGSPESVVERFLSSTLARAISAEQFAQFNGQPGQFLAVYVKNPQENIVRIIVGIGNDPGLLLNTAGR